MVNSDDLVCIDLALHKPGETQRVVALVSAKTSYGMELLLADDAGTSCVHSIPFAPGTENAPAHYRLERIGGLSTFMLKNKAKVDLVLKEDSKLEHGRLTIARAASAMGQTLDCWRPMR